MKRKLSCPDHPEWIIEVDMIGKGTRGSIHNAFNKNDSRKTTYAAKVSWIKESFERETEIYKVLNNDLGNDRIAPYMHDAFECWNDIFTKKPLKNPQYIIILDKIEWIHFGNLIGEIPYKTAYIKHAQLLHTLHTKYNISHGDPHIENVLFDKDKRGWLIDFEDGNINATVDEKDEDIELFEATSNRFGYDLEETFAEDVIKHIFPGFIEGNIDLHLCSLCKHRAKYRCGECNLINYCSQKCQNNDWRKHQKGCFKYFS